MAFIDRKQFELFGDHIEGSVTDLDGVADLWQTPLLTIDATGEKGACILRIPKSGTLNGIRWMIGEKTQWPVNGIRISFQDVSGVDADGTQDQYRVITTAPDVFVWQDSGLITSDGTDTGTKRTVTVGDWMAVVFEFESFSAGDDIDLAKSSTRAYVHGKYTENWRFFNASTWADVSSANRGGILLEYSDGSLEKLTAQLVLAESAGSTAVSSATTPDEWGIVFTTTIPYRLSGAAVQTSGWNNVSDDQLILLYDASNNVLATTTVLSPGGNNGAHSANSVPKIFFPFDSGTEVELAADTTYRLVIKGGTAAVNLNYLTYPSQEYKDVDLVPYSEGTVQGTSRTDAGAWTESHTSIPIIYPVANAIDPIKASVLSAVQKFFAPVFNRRHR